MAEKEDVVVSYGGGRGGFAIDDHVEYFKSMLQELPSPYEAQDTNRLVLAYLAVSALDLLNALHQVVAKDIIDWVYGLQVLPLNGDGNSTFEDGNSKLPRLQPSSAAAPPLLYDGGHMAVTYSALAILRILGDDFSPVARKSVLKSLQALQQIDGSFCPVHLGAEKDVRFSFCAAAICMMLDDREAMDLEKALEYVLSCQSYDGGFGLCPGLEPHGGATYCALATLKLVGRLTPKSENGDKFVALLPGHESLIGWCLRRQTETGGFQGRANKEADSCYAFWVGGSLQMLGGYNLCDKASLRSFLLSCQTKYGGFSKYPPTLGQTGFPDLLHSYYSICGFSLLEEPGLKSLCCELGISRRAADEFPLLIC
ncbi:unnamed protein product [Sphagnum troendelagicum]|uniref:Geranylgeranyl transferase type-1 subunit beta n=1 Tax=Sphagnum troendelagicum TaxID=128251 RepID=A0ABP0T9B6_9BRYO